MIIKGKWKEQFTIVPNAIFDAGMTAEAVGVLCYLIGRPLDWRVSAVALSNKFKCGKGRMNRVMHELEQHLYAIRRVGGAGGGFDWIITDDPKSAGNSTEPDENATIAKRDNRKTRQPQNRALLSKEGLQSTEEDKISAKADILAGADAPAETATDQRFAEFWNLYPRKTAKKEARKAWGSLRKAQQLDAIEHIKGNPFADREPRFIPHPSTYLRGERWGDESTTQPSRSCVPYH